MLRRRMLYDKLSSDVHLVKSLIGKGKQYIDTEIPVTDNTIIKASIYIEGFNTPYMNVFGTYLNECACIQSNSKMALGFSYKGINEFRNEILITVPGKFDILYDLSNKKYGINEVQRSFVTGTQELSNQTMWIFAKKKVGNVPDRIGAFKLYSFTIEELGKKKIDLYPALDANGVPCLYDKVSDRYFHNRGEGQFDYEELT